MAIYSQSSVLQTITLLQGQYDSLLEATTNIDQRLERKFPFDK